jgi:hypothetical protein
MRELGLEGPLALVKAAHVIPMERLPRDRRRRVRKQRASR